MRNKNSMRAKLATKVIIIICSFSVLIVIYYALFGEKQIRYGVVRNSTNDISSTSTVTNKTTTTAKTENYDDYKLDYSKVRIDDSRIRRIDSQYCNVEVTIKNNNKVSFNYIKLNVYFLDKYGDIIKSDWFNDSSCVKGGATQTITGRYIERPKEYSSYKLEIADVR